MKVTELTREQLHELKCDELCRRYDEQGDSPSYYELAFADEIISDDEIYDEYAGVYFVNDDFGCTAGMEEAE